MHQMIRSAWSIIAGEMVRPRALAVFPLMMVSNRMGCSTGMSAGFSPFKTRSTYTARARAIARWQIDHDRELPQGWLNLAEVTEKLGDAAGAEKILRAGDAANPGAVDYLAAIAHGKRRHDFAAEEHLEANTASTIDEVFRSTQPNHRVRISHVRNSATSSTSTSAPSTPSWARGWPP